MLKYDTASHVHCELPLHSGRHVTLRALDQRLTYGGWMEGAPWSDWNDRVVTSVMQQAGSKVFLIPPERRNYLRTLGDMDGLTALKGREPEWLPMVTCVGRFQHHQPVRDTRCDLSILVAVWFQNEFALPIDPDVMEQLRRVDWERFAEDVVR